MQMNNFSSTVFVVIMNRDTNLCCKGPDDLVPLLRAACTESNVRVIGLILGLFALKPYGRAVKPCVWMDLWKEIALSPLDGVCIYSVPLCLH